MSQEVLDRVGRKGLRTDPKQPEWRSIDMGSWNRPMVSADFRRSTVRMCLVHPRRLPQVENGQESAECPKDERALKDQPCHCRLLDVPC
jgi:hypothetical protein